jgi:hypothetical protein
LRSDDPTAPPGIVPKKKIPHTQGSEETRKTVLLESRWSLKWLGFLNVARVPTFWQFEVLPTHNRPRTIIIFDSEGNFEVELWWIPDAVLFSMLLDENDDIVVIPKYPVYQAFERYHIKQTIWFDSEGNFEVELWRIPDAVLFSMPLDEIDDIVVIPKDPVYQAFERCHIKLFDLIQRAILK